MKKIFIISLVLFFLLGSFYAAYNFLLKDPELTEITDVLSDLGDEKTKNEETFEFKKISKVTEGDILAVSLDESGSKIRYYDNINKGFWITSFDGSFKKKMSSDNFDGLKEAKWSEDGKRALLKINDAFYLYNYDEGEKLIKKTKSLSWIGFDQGIVYTFSDSENGKKTLNIANPDGSNWREIGVLNSDNLIMSVVPKSTKASFWPKADSFTESELTMVSFGKEGIETKGGLKLGADYLWSSEGNSFLRSSVAQKGSNKLVLEICNLKSESCSDLNLPTIAPKCVWLKNDKDIICALPKNIKTDSVWPNDYWSKKNMTEDSFWKINMETGKKERITEEKDEAIGVDAINLIASPNNDFIFFINRKDNQLYRVSI